MSVGVLEALKCVWLRLHEDALPAVAKDEVVQRVVALTVVGADLREPDLTTGRGKPPADDLEIRQNRAWLVARGSARTFTASDPTRTSIPSPVKSALRTRQKRWLSRIAAAYRGPRRGGRAMP